VELEDGIEAVSIATPNSTHYEICKAAICSGLHVICEKPLCFTVREAKELESLAREKGTVVGTMYGYSGYQSIEQARQMIAKGDLGEIRIINMQFAHGFHCEAVEEHSESLKWRVDPRVSGPSYVLGDLGTHPVYLAGVMLPHMKIKRLLCSRQSFVKTRAPLEDNAYTLMEYDNGAVGTVWCSGVNAGSMHNQKIRVIGSKASLEWWDEYPNQLRYEVQGRPVQILERGMNYLYPEALAEDRVSGGHPEGLFEAWSNLYARFALAIDAAKKGKPQENWYPGIEAGIEGVRWVENCVRSADNGAVWVEYQ
jgi:predicted dehydrogenase